MSMASEAAIAAPIASPISSLKYGRCHLSGDSMTPSSDTNSQATTFLMETSSMSVGLPHRPVAAYGKSARNQPRNLEKQLERGELPRRPFLETIWKIRIGLDLGAVSGQNRAKMSHLVFLSN